MIFSTPADKQLLAEKQTQIFKTTFFRFYLLNIRKNKEVNLRAADCMTHQYIFPEHPWLKGLPSFDFKCMQDSVHLHFFQSSVLSLPILAICQQIQNKDIIHS